MTTSVQTIKFHDQDLLATIVNGTPHIAMKPICENIGIDWSAQAQKIKRHPILSKGMVIITTPSKGGIQEMLTLPLRMLNGWLFLIDSNRVKPEVKNKVLEYQEECFDVLANHFLPKRNALVELPTLTPKQQRHAQDRVREIVNSQDWATYSIVWGSVKKEFDVGTYKDIKASKYPDLCEFLKCEPLEGELMPIENTFTNEKAIDQLKSDGYIVVRASKHGFEKMVMEFVPQSLFADLVEVVGGRMKAINFATD